MAKKDKKTKKKETQERNRIIGAALEAKGFDVAHKIWLAGVGAYGKAYDVAADGVGKVSGQSEVLFEDLVKRGEEIESDVRARLQSNTAVARMNDQMTKVNEQVAKVRGRVTEELGTVSEQVTKFQEEQRERLEERMERMRAALGLTKKGKKAKKADKLHAKLDQLEEEVADLRSNADGVDDTVKSRVERLSAEIAAVAGVKAKAPKKAKKKAKAVKPAAKKVTKPAAKKVTKAAPKTDANGRLTAPIGATDDLKVIKGVGPVLEKKLNAGGIFHYWQIAALKAAQVRALEAEMKFPGRIVRDGWVAQAKGLAK